MKTIKIQKLTVLLFLFLVGSMQSTEAQFWKKIKKRVKEGVEEAILRKTEEKATEKTENAIDSIFEAPKKLKKKKRKGKKGKRNSSKSKKRTFLEGGIDLPLKGAFRNRIFVVDFLPFSLLSLDISHTF